MRLLPRKLLIPGPIHCRRSRLLTVSARRGLHRRMLQRRPRIGGYPHRKRRRSRRRDCFRREMSAISRCPRSGSRIPSLLNHIRLISLIPQGAVHPWGRLSGPCSGLQGIRFHILHILRLRLFAHIRSRHFEGLKVKLRRRASLISIRNVRRVPPPWRALPIYYFVKERRVANTHIRTLEGLIIRQHSPELAVSHFPQSCPPCHHAQFSLWYRLPRKRCIPGNKQIFIATVAPPIEIHRVGFGRPNTLRQK